MLENLLEGFPPNDLHSAGKKGLHFLQHDLFAGLHLSPYLDDTKDTRLVQLPDTL
jgi:hypothetical protein